MNEEKKYTRKEVCLHGVDMIKDWLDIVSNVGAFRAYTSTDAISVVATTNGVYLSIAKGDEHKEYEVDELVDFITDALNVEEHKTTEEMLRDLLN